MTCVVEIPAINESFYKGGSRLINVDQIVGLVDLCPGFQSALLNADGTSEARNVFAIPDETVAEIRSHLKARGRTFVKTEISDQRTFSFCVEEFELMDSYPNHDDTEYLFLKKVTFGQESRWTITKKGANMVREQLLRRRQLDT